MRTVTLGWSSAERRHPDLGYAIRRSLRYALGKRWRDAVPQDLLQSTSLAVREVVIDRMLATKERHEAAHPKFLYYLSVEYLVGRSLANNLRNLGLLDEMDAVLAKLGIDPERAASRPSGPLPDRRRCGR
jgi:starch phosphorylase